MKDGCENPYQVSGLTRMDWTRPITEGFSHKTDQHKRQNFALNRSR